MNRRDLLYQRIFGSNVNDGKLLLNEGDQAVAKFVYDVACTESEDNINSIATSNRKLEATLTNLERVIELFENSVKQKKLFLETFEECSPLLKELFEHLKEISKSVKNHKLNCSVVKLVSGIVGALAGILLCFSCPIVSAPAAGAAMGLAALVLGGTSIVELCLMKRKANEATTLVRQIEREFKVMAGWFEFPDELKGAIGSLIDYNILTEIKKDMKKFFRGIAEKTKLTVGEFKDRFKEELQIYMNKMMKDSKISEIDDEIMPVIKTFLVVCLLQSQNQIGMDSVRIAMNNVAGLMGFGVAGGELLGQLGVEGEAVFGEVISKHISNLFVPVAVVLNLVIAFNAAKDLTETSRLEEKINEAVRKFETSFLFLENVYNRLKEFTFLPESDAIQRVTIIVLSVPHNAQQVDIKRAVKPFLLQEARGCITLKRIETNGNNWLVSVPTSHSELLLQQSELVIKEKRCVVSK